MLRSAARVLGFGFVITCITSCAVAGSSQPAEAAWPIVERAFGADYSQIQCADAAWGDLVTTGDTGSGPRCFHTASGRTAAIERDEILASIRAELPNARVVGRACRDDEAGPSDLGPYCDAIVFVEPESWNVLLLSFVPADNGSGYDVYVSSVDLSRSNDAFTSAE